LGEKTRIWLLALALAAAVFAACGSNAVPEKTGAGRFKAALHDCGALGTDPTYDPCTGRTG
jgi:hypothetical protein